MHSFALLGQIDFGMDPQAALDAPRFCIVDGSAGGVVGIEETVDERVVQELVDKGHQVKIIKGMDRSLFGMFLKCRSIYGRRDLVCPVWCQWRKTKRRMVVIHKEELQRISTL